MNLDPADLEDLERAVAILENPGLAARLTTMVGSPIEKALEFLPAPVSASVHEASRKAIGKALDLAVFTLDAQQRESSNATHKFLSGLSGALGGFFGAPALTVELPLSTMLMLRSIADIARSEGEDISALQARLACLEVFALGGRSQADNGAETGYYAVRAALASSVSEAAHYLAQQHMVDEGAPALVRLVMKIATRFGITVSQKFAAQAIPALGALGGASINLMFISHFQEMAKGHFTVRRLERHYGEEFIKLAYDRLRDESLL